MQLEPGTMVDGYRVERLAGRGAFGEVYRARLAGADEPVALKLLSPREVDDREIAGTLAQLDHRNIVRVLDVVRHQGNVCLIQEWADGGSLEDRLTSRTSPPLEAADVAQLGIAVASALAHAHLHGIVHRDVKPSNVLIVRGAYKLGDFGISAALELRTGLTATGQIAGTPLYMSPEQALGRPLSPTSDTFSLGLLLYRAVYGRLPDDVDGDPGELSDTGGDFLELLGRRIQGDIDVPPSPFQFVIQQCLALDPERRPQAVDVERPLRDIWSRLDPAPQTGAAPRGSPRTPAGPRSGGLTGPPAGTPPPPPSRASSWRRRRHVHNDEDEETLGGAAADLHLSDVGDSSWDADVAFGVEDEEAFYADADLALDEIEEEEGFHEDAYDDALHDDSYVDLKPDLPRAAAPAPRPRGTAATHADRTTTTASGQIARRAPYGVDPDFPSARRRRTALSAVISGVVAAAVVAVPLAALAWLGATAGWAWPVRLVLGGILVGGGLVLSRLVRERLASKVPEIERQAAHVLLGAEPRIELTQSLVIEVDELVRRLRTIDGRILGMTLKAMVDEYDAARVSSDRIAALGHVVTIVEKLRVHLSPWHVRHKEAVSTSVAVIGCLSGVASVVSGFIP